MYKLTKYELIHLSNDERDRIFDRVYNKKDNNYHYLAFERQLGGYSPIHTFISNRDESIMRNEKDIFETLLAKREVCSLYPRLNLTLYPVTKIENSEYEIDLENIDKHFADILELNDEKYKTKFLFVNFGQGATNFNQKLIIKKLRELYKKSKILQAIYIEYLMEEDKTSITIEGPVVKEGQFCNNQEIEFVRLPNPVRVCAGAFKDCKSLRYVDFGSGNGDVIIEKGAFDSCINLKDMVFILKKDTNITIDEEAFRNTNQVIAFHVPVESFKSLDEFAKSHNYKIKKVL